MSEVVPSLVSTIIPVYNRPVMLREAVESVLAQTYRPIEIIIVDDGSTDDTLRVGKALARERPGEIRFLAKDNEGPGPAREAGRQAARGEFIQYLDSDDLLRPRKFEIQVAVLRARPECGVAYGHTRLVDLGGRVFADPFKWTGKQLPTLFPGLLVDRWWCTHTPLYRRSVCDCIGEWTDLRWSQDWEYDGRVGALGTQLAYCPELVSEHRQHVGNRQTGTGHWLLPQDRVRFFSLLFKHATQAKVTIGSSEMARFSRWVFHHGRLCGALGDSVSARQCFQLACQAVGRVPRDMWLYKAIALCLGWRRAGTWACRLDRLRSIRAGIRKMPRVRVASED